MHSPAPRFGVDYDIGWAGFTDTGGAIALAIGYGERWERLESKRGTPTVTHAFVVIDAQYGVEAHAETGVVLFPLAKYLGDSKCRTYFQHPCGWTPEMGRRIADLALTTPPFGCPYDTRLIGAMAASYTLLGHAINRITGNWLKRALCRCLSTPNAFICSETVAFIYQQIPELKDLGWFNNARLHCHRYDPRVHRCRAMAHVAGPLTCHEHHSRLRSSLPKVVGLWLAFRLKRLDSPTTSPNAIGAGTRTGSCERRDTRV